MQPTCSTNRPSRFFCGAIRAGARRTGDRSRGRDSHDRHRDRAGSEEASAAEPKSAADLPELAAAAAAADPEAIAFTHGDQAVTFGELSTKLVAMRTAMGAALAPDALVSVSLAGLVPGILPALGVDGLATLVSSVIADAQSVSAGRGGTAG